MDSSCHHIILSFQAVDDIYKEIEVDIRGLAKGDDLSYGTKDLVNNNMIGKLKVSFDCALNSKIQFKEVSIYHASVGFHYRDPDFNVKNTIK